jgi:two-component system, sensor histidine kinase YesM
MVMLHKTTPWRRDGGYVIAARMRFQTRLLLTYSLLTVFLAVVLGVLFYNYNARYLERNAVSTYELVTSRVSQQVDSLISSMDFVMVNLLSDADFKSALSSLARLDPSAERTQVFFNEAANTIRSDLMIYSIHRDFHSAVVFNDRGDFFSSNFLNHVERQGMEDRAPDVPWLERIQSERGRPVVVGPYRDPWSDSTEVYLFGFARLIRGPEGNLGYVAVQNRASDLAEYFGVSESEYVTTIAWLESGEVLYASRDVDPAITDYYYEHTRSTGAGPGFVPNDITGERELIVSESSTITGLTTAVVINRNLLLDPLSVSRWLTVGLTVLIVIASIVYNWFSSWQLTRPLRHVHQRIEQAELTNLAGGDPTPHMNDEVAAMDLAFDRLRGRLDDAVRREIHSHTSWIQARLDSLQAQINPHFLFNVLTVIANRGLEVGDEEIGDLCDSIASMLRYSTSTTERAASLQAELEHVRSYLYLMGKRLEDRLQTRIEVDPTILDTPIPKIVLQQIVENAINHGYRNSTQAMNITISGERRDGWWVVTVADDGDGFDGQILDSLGEDIRLLKERLAAGQEDEGFEIGGLGLLNTYTRLHLYYDGEVIWQLENSPGGGATVTIGAPLTDGAAGEKHAVPPAG